MVRSRVPIALWAPAVLSAAVSLVPLVYLAVQAGTRGWAAVADEILQRRTFDLALRSLVLTAAVTLASAVLGVFAAWAVTLAGLRMRLPLTVLFSFPLAIPSYLAAFAWISWRPHLAGFTGAFIVLTFACFPYVMLPVVAALSRMDPIHEDVARSLGTSGPLVFVRVVLPQVRRAATAGSLLVALYALSDFGAPAAMRHEVFTWVIYGAYRAGFNPARAAVLSLVLVGLALLLTAGERTARGRIVANRTEAGSGRSRPRPTARVRALAYAGSTAILVPSIGVPVVSVVSWLSRDNSRGVDWGAVRSAATASFGIGVLAAAAALLAALPVALLAVRHRGRFAGMVEASTWITHALPGIVVAISVVYVGIRAVRPLYQEIPMVVLAHVVLFLPVMVTALKAAIEKSAPGTEEVARTLGAGPVAVFLRVTLPVALPGIVAGFALVMLAAVKELPATLLLRPTGLDTLSTRIWDFSTVSDWASVGPFALAILLLAAVPTAILGTLSAVKESSR